MKNNIGTIIIIIIVFFVICAIAFPHLYTCCKKIKEITQSKLSGEFKGFKFENTVKYDTIKEPLPDGKVKSVSNVISPVGAEISISTISSDNTQVAGMWQEGNKTVVIISPTDKVKK